MLTKNSFLDEINKQYVLTARAKGLTERRVLYGHVFRNAMLIVIAGFPAAFIGVLFTGALLIEVIFSLDGLGLLGFEAAINRDYPVMFGTLYFFTLIGLRHGHRRRPHVHLRRSAHRLRGARPDAARSTARRASRNFRANRRGTGLAGRLRRAVLRVACSPSASPTTGRCWSATTAPSTSRSSRPIRRRPSAATSRPRPTTRDPEVQQADRRQGLDALAADPLQLRHRRRATAASALAADAGSNWLGTDDQARDVLARLIYGFRISVLFGLVADLLSSIVGIAAGAVQGYFGGWVDLSSSASSRSGRACRRSTS